MHKLDIPLHVWIDGSFTTRKTDPDDVDIVVWVRESDAESLSPERLILFDSLLHIRNHDRIKAMYDVDVHLDNPDKQSARDKWADLFGKDRSNLNPKGIFTLLIHHV